MASSAAACRARVPFTTWSGAFDVNASLANQRFCDWGYFEGAAGIVMGDSGGVSWWRQNPGRAGA